MGIFPLAFEGEARRKLGVETSGIDKTKVSRCNTEQGTGHRTLSNHHPSVLEPCFGTARASISKEHVVVDPLV
jgi:hypothetical protein